jgi:hypothetical protein
MAWTVKDFKLGVRGILAYDRQRLRVLGCQADMSQGSIGDMTTGEGDWCSRVAQGECQTALVDLLKVIHWVPQTLDLRVGGHADGVNLHG